MRKGLHLVGLRAFEIPRAVVTPMAHTPPTTRELQITDELDTIIVPAQKDGFDEVFLGQNAWWAIRIAGGMLPKDQVHRGLPITARFRCDALRSG
jgi:hypothetical protein